MTESVSAVRTVRRSDTPGMTVQADVCVVGAGISGTTAAIMLARRGHRVALVDSCTWIGGQAVGVPIGTIAGLFSSGPNPFLLSPVLASEVLDALAREDACFIQYSRRARTNTVVYDEVTAMRIFEQMLRAGDVQIILGGVVTAADLDGRRIRAVDVATRFGACRIAARAFVDASGDAALAWTAGLACREPTMAIHGTQMCVLEGVVCGDPAETRAVVQHAEGLIRERGEAYGLTRREGVIFLLPSRQVAILNVTHVETPLDPVAFWHHGLEGREQVERAIALLKAEYPEVFGRAHVRSLGHPGIRQTRSIVGMHMLTVDEVNAGVRFPDAIARVAWPIELHDTAAGYRWEPFPDGHVHYIPLRSLLHAEADNLIATGRCIDADPFALSSVRVMGPCMATAVAAAECIDLALRSDSSLHDVDAGKVQERIAPNLDGEWPWPPEGGNSAAGA